VVSNWLCNTVFGALNKHKIALEANPIDANALGVILDNVSTGIITGVNTAFSHRA
jgi:Asp-tRNA(Asn)/Glu-tRNA(Gln) amidotransferase B subunit